MDVIELIKEKLEDKQVDCFKNMNLVKDEDGTEAGHIYDEYYNKSIAYEDAISIVDEVAQEYKNGWIPCSERMPELNQVCMWTVNKEKYLDTPYDIILGTYHLDLTYDIWKEWALAWQPLPAPYKEGGTE